jgi:drug/metabolite transporter (DMT)-like permease
MTLKLPHTNQTPTTDLSQHLPLQLPMAPLWLIAPFFFWGTAMVAMKGTVPHTTPFFLAGVRLLPAGVLVLLWSAWTGRSQPTTWKAWGWIGVFALVDGALFQGFLAAGLVRTSAGLGSVMIDSQPLAVALMAAWLFGERIGWIGWVGLLLGVLGISLLGLPVSLWATLGQGEWDPSAWDLVRGLEALFDNGQWLMLLAALSMAVGTIVSRFVSRHADPVVATGWHMILGGLPLFGLSAALETEQWQHLQSADWSALAYSTVFGSAIAYGLFFYFAAQGSLTSLSALTFLTPVFALLFGNLFLAETLTPLQWTGVGLTLTSIYLINQRELLKVKLQGASLLTEQAADETAAVSPMAEETIAQGSHFDPKVRDESSPAGLET